MSDRTELSKDVENLDVDYLAEFVEDDTSLEGLEEYFIPSVLKKIEANSRQTELIDEYGAGSVILTPQNICIWKKGDAPFKFVPILFTPIVRKWLDFKDPEGPMVLETSFDISSELSKIARSAERRNSEGYGNSGFKYQHVEHLTFLGILYDGEHAGTQCMLSFERSGHFKGKSFITAIQSRKINVKGEIKKQPLWSQVWGLELIDQSNSKGRWNGFNFRVCEPKVIEKQFVEPFRELHNTWKEMQKKQKIVYSDESTDNNVNIIEDDDGNNM